MDNPDEKIKMSRAEKIQISAMVITIIFICVLIITLGVLVKNIDEIKSFPVQYAVDKGLVNSCTCYDTHGNVEYFGDEVNRFIADT